MYTMVLADDEEIELKALGLLIQKEFRDIDVVATARNGTELVTQVQRHQPDIAIVDINMPGISGIDAIDLLRSRSGPNEEVSTVCVSSSTCSTTKLRITAGWASTALQFTPRQHSITAGTRSGR